MNTHVTKLDDASFDVHIARLPPHSALAFNTTAGGAIDDGEHDDDEEMQSHHSVSTHRSIGLQESVLMCCVVWTGVVVFISNVLPRWSCRHFVSVRHFGAHTISKCDGLSIVASSQKNAFAIHDIYSRELQTRNARNWRRN